MSIPLLRNPEKFVQSLFREPLKKLTLFDHSWLRFTFLMIGPCALQNNESKRKMSACLSCELANIKRKLTELMLHIISCDYLDWVKRNMYKILNSADWVLSVFKDSLNKNVTYIRNRVQSICVDNYRSRAGLKKRNRKKF